jgi:nucleoside-diphosphate-sugar epimerase
MVDLGETVMRILVTGAFGWTARAILQALHDAGHEIVAFDLPDTKREQEILLLSKAVFRGSVADFHAVKAAMTGVKAVVHLAVAVGEGDYESSSVPFSTNVQGTYHVFEAARQQGVGKVVLMSEASVHLPRRPAEVVYATDPLKTADNDPAEHLYDLTKRLQEEIARDYAAAYRTNVVVLRAGHIVDGRAGVDPHGRPLAQVGYLRGGWVCHYDVATAVLKALTYPPPGYQAFNVVGSESARQAFEIERTERSLGMEFVVRFRDYETAQSAS